MYDVCVINLCLEIDEDGILEKLDAKAYLLGLLHHIPHHVSLHGYVSNHMMNHGNNAINSNGFQVPSQHHVGDEESEDFDDEDVEHEDDDDNDE